MKQRKVKRWVAGFLALLILTTTALTSYVPMTSYAASFTGRNIWSGGSEVIFGNNRSYLFRWSDGFQNTFCIAPGRHMGSNVNAYAGRYNINDSDIPYIDSAEDFQRIALICDWYEKKAGAISASNASYAAAQTAIWAVISGQWENATSMAAVVNKHVSGTSSKMTDLLDYLEHAYPGANGLPEWVSTNQTMAAQNPQNMTLMDGGYRLELDISSCPDLAQVSWELPNGFSQSLSGTTLIFTYTGAETPLGEIRGAAPASMAAIRKNSENLTIYSPDNETRDQAMVSAGLTPTIDILYINIGGTKVTTPTGESPVVEIFRHKETFESNYHIDLKKYCAETGMELEGSIFDVLEAFDSSQLGDGEDGSVSKAQMSPKPATWDGWKNCGQMLTDENGHAEHSDRKFYNYNKTYCGGHPEPEYVDVPEAEEDEETGETTNQDEIDAAEAENERLRAEWEALIELCEEETDFHDIEEGVAQEMMIEDRDDTYDTFTNLVYQYTVKEKTARSGYIVHGNHNDDQAIEVIATDASEAGANAVVISARKSLAESRINGSAVNQGAQLAGISEKWESGLIQSVLPELSPVSLDERREIISGSAEAAVATSSDATPSNAETATPANAGKKRKATATTSNAAMKDDETLWEEYLETHFADGDDLPLFDDVNFDDMESWLDSFRNGSRGYQYLLHPLSINAVSAQPFTATASNAETGDTKETAGLFRSLISLFSDDEDDEDDEDDAPLLTVSVSLPEPELDDVADVTAGTSGNLSYTFEIENHRTEGELHINKRDLELYQNGEADSYGAVQGDATLQGAVYGLYASADIIHPDGKTGVVYKAGDLVSIATTNENGDASFLCYTEESDTSLSAANKAGTWIGHSLLLGSYYIQEISRSEGYELSVTGINLTESNRLGDNTGTYLQAGEVSASTFSHRVDDQDGTWNDTTIRYFKTENGFDVVISGYPEQSQIFEVQFNEDAVTEHVVVDSQLVPKTDESGDPVYQKAVGGELKLDASGNPIPSGGEDLSNPVTETWYTYHRIGRYPSGTAVPQVDPGKWADPAVVDETYLKAEINDMLNQLGYFPLSDIDGDGAPWLTINLTGTTNEALGTEIFDWYAEHDFFNCGAVESVWFNGSIYQARIFYDYQGQSGSSVYDSRNGVLYIKKTMDVAGGAASSHAWLAYPAGTFRINSFYAILFPKMEFQGTIPFGDTIEDYLVEKYQPNYERYTAGEVLLDASGNPIPEMEWQHVYDDVSEVIQTETLTPVPAVYDPVKGTYTIHVENEIDWNTVTERQEITYRVQAPKSSIVVDGKTMDYSDYLVQIAGAGVTVMASRTEVEEGSYVKFANLIYPGQIQVYQDDGTRNEPVQVLQRAIKQSIKVTKDISKKSYEEHNTYKIHRDPFTVLFGGYIGSGRKYVADFHFKLYLVSDLADAGLLEMDAQGNYDYKKLFQDETKRAAFDQFAVEWDRAEKDMDGDLTTIHASEGTGAEPYYGQSIMLPYGTYVIVEQIPRTLVNKHYELDDPQEVTLPFVPHIEENGTVYEEIPSSEYLYFSSYSPEEMQERFFIRFNEENHMIDAHNHDGDYQVYKYGLDPDLLPNPYENSVVGERYRYGQSENAGIKDTVYYEFLYDGNGSVVDYGVTLTGVDTMSGVSTTVNGKYAAALVPWSVVDPRQGGVMNDQGDIGNREPGLESGSFNFVAFAKKHFENTFYSSKLRVEKVDGATGENIIHDGAIFKIYAASRDVKGQGLNQVVGSGNVLFETITVTGTRPELEARGDVDQIVWDEASQVYTGTVTRPVYEESEQIFMVNEVGEETGIFKAFSTEHTVLKADGTVRKEKVGYIETYQPLGAGVYVLVEQQAPAGYQKSKPIAFEIYKDEAAYYPEGDAGNRTAANRFQYVIPLTTTNEIQYQDVAQVVVTDSPSKLYIHKVEDGDRQVGDKNGLDELHLVNDAGDLLTYMVRGRKEYLEARGDVADIQWDATHKEYVGTVTKPFDEWSETVISGTEAELLAMENVKPLYEADTGFFSGYGIEFDIYVKEAVMSLYEGLVMERTGANAYAGVTVQRENGKVVSVQASKTGSHLEITNRERDTVPPYLPIWDTEEILNEAVELYFYDLAEHETEADEETGELWVLDDTGNRICYVDSVSGMAYTKDDYGTLIAYRAVDGNKVLAQSIEVHNDGGKDHIYVNLIPADDEVGLPLYYESGEVTYRPEQWTTDGSPHVMERLPFGAYVLEETKVPYDQGYTKVPDMGLILRESSEEQHFYYQNVFTKLNLAKVDVTTKAEIQDAGMTLYTAVRVPDESERGYSLEKGDVYASWISGYEYDDDGVLKLDEHGDKIPTSEPHWLDHIPVGEYILEETIVPYDKGYVQSESMEIVIGDTGNVQTGVMEDDYTGLEIKKFDTKSGAVLDNEHSARLALYQAELDENGLPLLKITRDIFGKEIPVYQEANQVVTWWTKDGADVAATRREVTDEYGDTHMLYDYERVAIPATKQAYYYITEKGTTMFHYLPVGYYVLVEEENPESYATADPVLIHIQDIGHLEQVHYGEMPDYPLTLDVSKVAVSRGKEVKDAFLQIFKVDEQGNRQEPAMYEWFSGTDGVYTAGDLEQGLIPDGLEVGDLKPHRIEYIPEGNYVLVESMTPYGFLQSVEIPFAIIDTQIVQYVEMVDEIPDGLLEIVKRDSEEPEWVLESATFEFWNKTLGILVETMTTDETGKAVASNAVPIGYLDQQGNFQPYTYEVIEVDAPDTHMINRLPFEFQFQYVDEKTPLIPVVYDAINDINQVKVSKKELTSQEELPGAEMMVTGKYTKIIVDTWISTEQPHYIKGILPGEYVLTEITVPSPGYVKAESIEFTVTENMEVIPYLVMYDDHTKVEIKKLKGTSEQYLAGAKLQLSKPDGTVMYQWVTTEEAYVINGLEPGDYVLEELESPAGYKKGQPMIITVEETTDMQTFLYRNYVVKSSGGGGSTTKPGKSYIHFKKVDAGGKLLAGAEFTFFDANGAVIATAVSSELGVIQIERPAVGNYTFKETKAPDAYLLSDREYTFSIDSSGKVMTEDFEIVNYPAEKIVVLKQDGNTHELLAGAEFSVECDGEELLRGTTDEFGMFTFLVPSAGNYVIREVKAPEHYICSEQEYRIQVNPDGSVEGETTIIVYNNKESWIPFFPKTGDDSNIMWYLAGVCVFGGALMVLMVYGAKRKKDSEE